MTLEPLRFFDPFEKDVSQSRDLALLAIANTVPTLLCRIRQLK